MQLSDSLTIRLDSRKAVALRLRERLTTLLNSRPDWKPSEAANYVLDSGLNAIEAHNTLATPAKKGGRK